MKLHMAWLLEFAASRQPLGFGLKDLPAEAPRGISMSTVRGLEQRGWLSEDADGIIHATTIGVKASTLVRNPPNKPVFGFPKGVPRIQQKAHRVPPTTEADLLGLRDFIKSHPEHQSGWDVVAAHFGVNSYRISKWMSEAKDRRLLCAIYPWEFEWAVHPKPWERSKSARYRLYLRSAHWARVRELVRARSGGRCERCGGKATQVHHNSYEHLGLEDFHLSDVEDLCRRCHKNEHQVAA